MGDLATGTALNPVDGAPAGGTPAGGDDAAVAVTVGPSVRFDRPTGA